MSLPAAKSGVGIRAVRVGAAALVQNGDAGRVMPERAGIGGRQRPLGFDIDGFGMADKDRDAGGDDGRDADRVVAHDLMRFMDQFHLFRRVPIVVKAADLRNDIGRDLHRKRRAGRRDGAIFRQGAVLRLQFIHRRAARAGDGLISRDQHPRNPNGVMQRLQGQNQLRRGAVRIRDNAVMRSSMRRR